MALPFDPATLTPADIGEERAVLALDHEAAVEVVRECCIEAGFGIPVEFSPAELLNERIDADRDPYYVLGACNPEMADRALTASEQQIGGLFPCNMVVWEQAPERQQVYHASIMRIARLAGLAPDDEEWSAIVDETGTLVKECFELIRGHAAAE